MTPQHIQLVQESWQHVQPIAEKAAELFYARLFALDPSLRPLFKAEMTSQRAKLMAAIGMVVAGLTRLEKIVPTVRALGARHAAYGVQPEHFETVGEALLWTLEAGLGERFTADVRDAWSEAYAVLSGTMKQAMAEAGRRAA